MKAIALTAGVVTAGIGALHLVWARSPWPFRSEQDLIRTVVGTPSGELPQPLFRIASAAVGAGLAAAGWIVAADGGALPAPVPQRWTTAATGAFGAVLIGRGLWGMYESGTGRGDHTEVYRRRDLQAYSPLCLVLGSTVVAVAAT